MSIKEAERLGIMRQIDKEKLTIAKASEELGLSLRQTKRVSKRGSGMWAKGWGTRTYFIEERKGK